MKHSGACRERPVLWPLAFVKVFTGKVCYSGWLNMAEIEIGVAQRQCLSRRIAEKPLVEHELQKWSQNRNAANAITDWQFTTADARIKLKRLYPSSV